MYCSIGNYEILIIYELIINLIIFSGQTSLYPVGLRTLNRQLS